MITSPGRLEVIGREPLVVLDGAHNAAASEALGRALAQEFIAAPRTFVIGLLRGKQPLEMLEALGVADAAHVVCTRAPSPRALDPVAVAEAARSLGVDDARIDIVDDVAAAVDRAREVTGPDGQIVVTGSLYVVGAARAAR